MLRSAEVRLTTLIVCLFLLILSNAQAQAPTRPCVSASSSGGACPFVSSGNPLPVAVTGGAGGTIGNPLYTAGAELPVDTTGTFTNATQATSITASNLDGYGTALVTVNGTYGTATAIFELSDDGGASWFSVQGSRTNSCTVETGYTGLTNTAQAWTIPISGADSFRVHSSAVASGTVNVRISISSAVAPSSTAVCGSVSATISPTALSANGITPIVSAAAEGSHVLKASAGNLYSLAVTTGGTAGYVMVFNLTSAPADGAVTPVECIVVAANSSVSINYNPGPPEAYATGITVVFSSTGCFNKTISATAFFNGKVQ